MLGHVISTLLMLLVVALAGWAVASLLRSPPSTRDPQQDWEFWLEASGMRPVIPRTRPVAEAASAIGRPASEVHRAAMGRAGDQALLVIAQLVGGETLIAAQRFGPLPPGVARRLSEPGVRRRRSRGAAPSSSPPPAGARARFDDVLARGAGASGVRSRDRSPSRGPVTLAVAHRGSRGVAP